MTKYLGKMRMPVEKISKQSKKESKMKSLPPKKRKVGAAKAMDDSISETISFVIKGHLTPLKSTVLAKKTNVGKKKLKTRSKDKAVKKSQPSRKTPQVEEDDPPKPMKPAKVVKKTAKKSEGNIKIKKTVAKNIKNQTAVRKSPKRNVADVINSLVLPDAQKGDIGKSSLINHAANKLKNEISEKPPKKNVKESKQITKAKTETVESKKQTKNYVIKRRKSPSKSEIIEKDKQIKEKKADVGGKKIKKSVELKMKNSSPNCPQQQDNKNTLIKPKSTITTTKVKQDVKDKPKKSRVSSTEHKQVKKDVKTVTSKTPKNNLITEEVKPIKTELPEKKSKQSLKKQTKRKIKSEDSSLSTDDTSSTSDEITLDVLRQHHSEESKIKSEPSPKRAEEGASPTSGKTPTKIGQGSDSERKNASQKPAAIKQKLGRKAPEKKATEVKSKTVLIKKGMLTTGKNKAKRKEDQRSRKMKLFGFWNGPKRHRVASLNALAKVHCLYENETRGALLDADPTKSESNIERKIEAKQEEILPTRTLRSAPGLRGAGKHWDMHDETFSSSEDNESPVESPKSVTKEEKVEKTEKTDKTEKPDVDKKPEKKRTYTKRRRNRCELIMDLKDMVVRKRMASLNASAILAASYSVEKRTAKSPKSEETDSEDSEESFTRDTDNKKKCYEEDVKKEEDRKVIEVRATPNKKVSVILNQDTDVTITGVYVNSTTRSTHHEGYCSIAGMQYRISAKSHTQTASTTVATETIMQSAANIGAENKNVSQRVTREVKESWDIS
ncbi:hypothetical protein ILUMI_27049 [Ignelater luminosus]|uniref:Uncharacterized protein n=1 Tax=Ignelater luminosus TaxID=2038154 RepID=A0A8K0FYJ3_IGNLU|nr:hypothetical protein ILUMI_27049 [Ignelater luminosus]